MPNFWFETNSSVTTTVEKRKPCTAELYRDENTPCAVTDRERAASVGSDQRSRSRWFWARREKGTGFGHAEKTTAHRGPGRNRSCAKRLWVLLAAAAENQG